MKAIRMAAFAAVLAFVLPTVAEDKEAKFDAAKMLGTWTITSGKKAGTALGDEGKKGEYVITKDKITAQENGKATFIFDYTVDAKADPVTIDMTIAESPIEGLKGSKAKGILELKGDTLKLSYDGMGSDRPKKLDDDKANVFEMKRKKEDKKAEKKEEKN